MKKYFSKLFSFREVSLFLIIAGMGGALNLGILAFLVVQVDKMGNQVLELSAHVETLATELEQIITQAKVESMADHNIIVGDTSIGRPTEANYVAADNTTVRILVYKAVATETDEETTARFIAAFQSAKTQYPGP